MHIGPAAFLYPHADVSYPQRCNAPQHASTQHTAAPQRCDAPLHTAALPKSRT